MNGAGSSSSCKAIESSTFNEKAIRPIENQIRQKYISRKVFESVYFWC